MSQKYQNQMQEKKFLGDDPYEIIALKIFVKKKFGSLNYLYLNVRINFHFF